MKKHTEEGTEYGIPETPGRRLQQLIKRSGIKQKDFAERTGVVANSLCRYVTGKQNLPDHYIEISAEILGVPSAYIRNGDTTDVDLPTLGLPKKEREDLIMKKLKDVEVEISQMRRELNILQRQIMLLCDILATKGDAM